MFWFIVGIVLVIAAVFVFIVGYGYEDDKKWPIGFKATTAGLILVAAIVIMISSLTAVQSKFVGVGETFGKVESRTYNPGLNWKAPWTKIHQIDATVQTDQYNGDSAIVVKTGDGMETHVSLANRWRINPEAAGTIYQDYRSNDPTDSFRKAVIDQNLKSVVQAVLASYNPIEKLQESGQGTTSLSFMPDVVALGNEIQQKLDASIAKTDAGLPLATIISVTVSGIKWSDATQAKIDAFNTEVANTRVATQREQTAKAEAAANEALANSIRNDPNVLVSKCLDTVQAAVDKGYALPAGFSCWPGGGTGVVIPSK